MFRNHEVCWSRTFANAGCGIIMRSVARAEIAAKFTFDLTLRGTQWHTAEMGANAQSDQPVFFAGGGPLGESLGIAQTVNINRVGLADFRFRQVANEDWLLAPAGLDRLAGFDRGNINLDR